MEPIREPEIVLFTKVWVPGGFLQANPERKDAGVWCSQNKRKPLGGIPFPVGSLHF